MLTLNSLIIIFTLRNLYRVNALKTHIILSTKIKRSINEFSMQLQNMSDYLSFASKLIQSQ